MRLTPVVTRTALVGSLITGLLLAGATVSTASVPVAAPPPDPAPSPGPVEFDFDTNVGFVDESNIRQGFDWDAAALATNAGHVAFQQEKLVQDTYSVTCGPAGSTPITVVHFQQAARFFLIGAAVSGTPSPSTAPPALLGFRITGSRAAISSTTVAPLTGTPCPETGKGKTVTTSRVVATTTTKSLVAEFDDRTTTLLTVTTGPATGD